MCDEEGFREFLTPLALAPQAPSGANLNPRRVSYVEEAGVAFKRQ
jgi:hypothetical protein